MTRNRTLILAVILLVCRAAPAGAFEKVHHEQMTDAALPFLEPEIRDAVIDGNLGRDFLPAIWRKADEWHFNDCEFDGASRAIRETYDEAVTLLSEGGDTPSEDAATQFGVILHVVQDFYAHSNWVELQLDDGAACDTRSANGQAAGIVDDGFESWPAMRPWSTIRGTVVVQETSDEEARAHGIDPRSLRWTSRTKKAQVETSSGETRSALVTGEVYYLVFALPIANECPSASKALHWDVYGGEDELHKDAPGQCFHDLAIDLATRQTRHEWCRLISLTYAKLGQEGVARLLAAWVADPQAALEACTSSAFPVPRNLLPDRQLAAATP